MLPRKEDGSKKKRVEAPPGKEKVGK